MAAPNKSSLAALLLAGTAVLAASPASATLTQSATFDEKVENAAAIVIGKCVKTEAKWDPSKRWILTYSTFKVEKSLKGNAGAEVTVVTPGGNVGGIYQDTIGVPEFREGEESVVFVKNSSAGPTVLYFDQGAYEVKQADGERIVVPVESDAIRVDDQRGVAVPEEGPRSLRQFESAVRESQRRASFNRMEMIRKQQQPQPSFLQTVARYKYILLAAFLGLALATIHLLRR
jgi:hypothetical protein